MKMDFGSNIINEADLPQIWKEISLIESAMHSPEETGAAIGLKSGKGFLADDFMVDAMFPKISSLKDFVNHQGRYSLLINYYGDKDYYKPHTDDSIKTLTILLSKEEDAFEGGDFKFEDLDIILPFEHNSFILFDGNIKHEVTPVQLKKTTGRYSLNYFFY